MPKTLLDLPQAWEVELTAWPDVFRVNAPGERTARVRRFWHELTNDEKETTKIRAALIESAPALLDLAISAQGIETEEGVVEIQAREILARLITKMKG